MDGSTGNCSLMFNPSGQSTSSPKRRRRRPRPKAKASPSTASAAAAAGVSGQLWKDLLGRQKASPKHIVPDMAFRAAFFAEAIGDPHNSPLLRGSSDTAKKGKKVNSGRGRGTGGGSSSSSTEAGTGVGTGTGMGAGEGFQHSPLRGGRGGNVGNGGNTSGASPRRLLPVQSPMRTRSKGRSGGGGGGGGDEYGYGSGDDMDIMDGGGDIDDDGDGGWREQIKSTAESGGPGRAYAGGGGGGAGGLLGGQSRLGRHDRHDRLDEHATPGTRAPFHLPAFPAWSSPARGGGTDGTSGFPATPGTPGTPVTPGTRMRLYDGLNDHPETIQIGSISPPDAPKAPVSPRTTTPSKQGKWLPIVHKEGRHGRHCLCGLSERAQIQIRLAHREGGYGGACEWTGNRETTTKVRRTRKGELGGGGI